MILHGSTALRIFFPAVAPALLALWPAVAAAEEARIRIPRDDCARLVQHQSAPDVAYKPGVDVRGKKVAPADLPGSGFSVAVPEEVEFDVSFNPLRGGAASRFERSKLIVGRVRFNLETGEATFNGVPLTDSEQAELARKCQRILSPR